MAEKVSNQKTSKNKIITVVSVIIILGIIAVLSIFGGDFKDSLFAFLKANAENKSPYLIFVAYLFVYIGSIVEGEGVLFLTVIFLCNSFKIVTLPGVIIVGALGGTTGDNLYFYLFKRGNTDKWLANSKRLKDWYPKVKRMVEKYGLWTVVASRFLLGMRNCVALVCATGNMPHIKFSSLNLLSAFLWSTFFCCAIYYGEQTFMDYFDIFKKFWIAALGIIILTGIIIALIKSRKSKKRDCV